MLYNEEPASLWIQQIFFSPSRLTNRMMASNHLIAFEANLHLASSCCTSNPHSPAGLSISRRRSCLSLLRGCCDCTSPLLRGLFRFRFLVTSANVEALTSTKKEARPRFEPPPHPSYHHYKVDANPQDHIALTKSLIRVTKATYTVSWTLSLWQFGNTYYKGWLTY